MALTVKQLLATLNAALAQGVILHETRIIVDGCDCLGEATDLAFSGRERPAEYLIIHRGQDGYYVHNPDADLSGGYERILFDGVARDGSIIFADADT